MAEENSDQIVSEQPTEPAVVDTPATVAEPGPTPPVVQEVVQDAAPESVQEVVQDVVMEPAPVPVVENDKSSVESSGQTAPVTQEEIPQAVSVNLSEIPAQSVQQTIVEKIVFQPTREMMRVLQKLSLVAIQTRKRKKIEKIMTFFTKKQKITTADIQKILIISHNTAVRYMDVLEKEGRVRQIGKKGSSVHYIKI